MTRKEVVKKVLDEFFGTDETEESVNGYLGITLDEEDTEILAEAIEQALVKEDENQN